VLHYFQVIKISFVFPAHDTVNITQQRNIKKTLFVANDIRL